MYLWRVNRLTQDFIEGKVTEREKFKYFLALVVVEGIAIGFLGNDSWTQSAMLFIQALSILILSVLATCLSYKANGQGDNTDFISRYICLSFPLMIWMVAIIAGFYFVLYFNIGLAAALSIDLPLLSKLEDNDTFDTGFILICEVIYYFLLFSKIKHISASRIGPLFARPRILANARVFALLALVTFALPAIYLSGEDFLKARYALLFEEEDEDSYEVSDDDGIKYLIAEEVLFDQPERLHRTLNNLKATTPKIPDMYFVSFGAYGYQDVFMNEALTFKELFEQRFNMKGRAVALVNNVQTVDRHPIASVTNLRRTLLKVAERMNIEEDILFLFMTSHGSEDHELSVNLPGVPLQNLPAEDLAEILDESGIKWKVLVVSSCYSGGFIESLKDETTMIITASRKDRTSFGCSDDAEFTYFGNAFFLHALEETNSFTEAFPIAASTVYAWEEDENYEHSEPQFFSTPLIEDKLAQWRATLPVQTSAAKKSS